MNTVILTSEFMRMYNNAAADEIMRRIDENKDEQRNNDQH